MGGNRLSKRQKGAADAAREKKREVDGPPNCNPKRKRQLHRQLEAIDDHNDEFTVNSRFEKRGRVSETQKKGDSKAREYTKRVLKRKAGNLESESEPESARSESGEQQYKMKHIQHMSFGKPIEPLTSEAEQSDGHQEFESLSAIERLTGLTRTANQTKTPKLNSTGQQLAMGEKSLEQLQKRKACVQRRHRWSSQSDNNDDLFKHDRPGFRHSRRRRPDNNDKTSQTHRSPPSRLPTAPASSKGSHNTTLENANSVKVSSEAQLQEVAVIKKIEAIQADVIASQFQIEVLQKRFGKVAKTPQAAEASSLEDGEFDEMTPSYLESVLESLANKVEDQGGRLDQHEFNVSDSLRQLAKDLKCAKKKQTAIEDDIKSLNNKHTWAKGELTQRKNEIAAHEKANVQANMQAKDAELEAMRASLAQVQERNTTLETQCAGHDDAIRAINERITRKFEDVWGWADSKDAADDEADKNNSDRFRKQNEILGEEANALRRRIAVLEAQMNH